jgi:hypothetical protein
MPSSLFTAFGNDSMTLNLAFCLISDDFKGKIVIMVRNHFYLIATYLIIAILIFDLILDYFNSSFFI